MTGRGSGVGFKVRGLSTLAVLGVVGAFGCGDSEERSRAQEKGSGGSAGGGEAGSQSASGGVSAGRGGLAGAANEAGTGPSAGDGGMGDGGDQSGAGAGQGGGPQGGAGGSGGDAPATSEEVAASCQTPLMGALLPDGTFGWNTAALRIDVTAPSCVLQPGMGVGSGGNALYFAHETNDTYSLWSDSPWSFTLESGQSANSLPQDQALTVFPFLDDVRLRVVFTLSGESVTVSTVEAQ